MDFQRWLSMCKTPREGAKQAKSKLTFGWKVGNVPNFSCALDSPNPDC
jgi:hypothetical protein